MIIFVFSETLNVIMTQNTFVIHTNRSMEYIILQEIMCTMLQNCKI